MADIISLRITSSHYESHYVTEEITFFFFFFPGDMASDAQPSGGIGLLSFFSFSHFVMLGHGGLLHQCFGRWVQDDRHAQIRWGKVCRRREGCLSLYSFSYSLISLRAVSPKNKQNKSISFPLSVYCISLCLVLWGPFWGTTLSCVLVTPVKHTPVMCH